MPASTEYPRPSLLLRGKSWSVFWSYKGKTFVCALGVPADQKLFANRWLADFAVALASDKPAFPDRYAAAPAVVRYCAARYGVQPVSAPPAVSLPPSGWLADYAVEIKAALSSAAWVRDSLSRLRKLEAAFGSLDALDAASASEYLARLPVSPASRNRALAIFSRFYKWVVRTGRSANNPFEKIKQVRETRPVSISYCTAADRSALIAAAQASGWPDWLAVPIAFYAGLRRGEVAALRWEDVRFAEGLIHITKSKTGRARLVPLHKDLEALLSAVPAKDRSGFVVAVPPGVDRAYRLENLARHISRSCPGVPCGWNVFRHTFGSLAVQAGVPLDRVCAWMGNTPDVCRRHYAQFVPRGMRDNSIDML